MRLDESSVTALKDAGIVPAQYDGKLLIQSDPTSFWVASAKSMRGDWLFAFEYARLLKHQTNSLPQALRPWMKTPTDCGLTCSSNRPVTPAPMAEPRSRAQPRLAFV